MSVYGTRIYGMVDRVPGICAVTTVFFHINFIPLVPLSGLIVIDGAWPDEGYGVRLPMSPQSVVLGYLRGWLGAVAVLSTAMSLGMAPMWLGLVEPKGTPSIIGFLAGLVMAMTIGGFAVASQLRAGTWAALGLVAVLPVIEQLAYAKIAADPAWAALRAHELGYLPSVPWAVGALLLSRSTWMAGEAGPNRALGLLTMLRFKPEEIERVLAGEVLPPRENGWSWPDEVPISR